VVLGKNNGNLWCQYKSRESFFVKVLDSDGTGGPDWIDLWWIVLYVYLLTFRFIIRSTIHHPVTENLKIIHQIFFIKMKDIFRVFRYKGKKNKSFSGSENHIVFFLFCFIFGNQIIIDPALTNKWKKKQWIFFVIFFFFFFCSEIDLKLFSPFSYNNYI